MLRNLSGFYCFEPIKFLVLGVCDDDSGLNVDNLSDLICGFDVLSIDGMEHDDDMDSDSDGDSDDDSDSSTSSGRNRRRLSPEILSVRSNGMVGIRINQRIDEQMTFRLCLDDVFLSTFSDRVQIRRGNSKYLCSEQWLDGMPCLNQSAFIDAVNEESADGMDGVYRVEGVGEELEDHNQLTASPFVRWEVLSAVILAILCVVGLCGYALILRTRSLRKQGGPKRQRHERVNAEEEWIEDEMEMVDRDSLDGDGDGDGECTQITRFRRIRNRMERAEMMDLSDSEIDDSK